MVQLLAVLALFIVDRSFATFQCGVASNRIYQRLTELVRPDLKLRTQFNDPRLKIIQQLSAPLRDVETSAISEAEAMLQDGAEIDFIFDKSKQARAFDAVIRRRIANTPMYIDDKIALLALHDRFVRDRGNLSILSRTQLAHFNVAPHWATPSIRLSGPDELLNSVYLHELRHFYDFEKIRNKIRVTRSRRYAAGAWNRALGDPDKEPNLVYWTEHNASGGDIIYPGLEKIRRLANQKDFLVEIATPRSNVRNKVEQTLKEMINEAVKSIEDSWAKRKGSPAFTDIANRRWDLAEIQEYIRDETRLDREKWKTHWKTPIEQLAFSEVQSVKESLEPYIRLRAKLLLQKNAPTPEKALPDNVWKEVLLLQAEGKQNYLYHTSLVNYFQAHKSNHSKFENILLNKSRLPFAEYRRSLRDATFEFGDGKISEHAYEKYIEPQMLLAGYDKCVDFGALSNPKVIEIMFRVAEDSSYAAGDLNITEDPTLKPLVKMLKANKRALKTSKEFNKQLKAQFEKRRVPWSSLRVFLSYGAELPDSYWTESHNYLTDPRDGGWWVHLLKYNDGWQKRSLPILTKFFKDYPNFQDRKTKVAQVLSYYLPPPSKSSKDERALRLLIQPYLQGD